jgi:hypothetical protein
MKLMKDLCCSVKILKCILLFGWLLGEHLYIYKKNIFCLEKITKVLLLFGENHENLLLLGEDTQFFEDHKEHMLLGEDYEGPPVVQGRS